MERVRFILIFFALVSICIVFHEFGHFIAYKSFKVPVETISFGFGPALIKHNYNETSYQIALIPLGGYVSIESSEIKNLVLWQKLITQIAGVTINLLLVVILLPLYLLRKGEYNNLKDKPLKILWLMVVDALSYIHSVNKAIWKKILTFSAELSIVPSKETTTEIQGLQIAFYEQILLWFILINVSIGLFNLLPIIFLDGGRIFYTIASNVLGNKIGIAISKIISFAITFSLLWGTFGKRAFKK